MDKILNISQAVEKSTLLREQKKNIILTGGCFDILHVGHIRLLSKAKMLGGVLFVMLEHDQKIRSLKGSSRPIHSQEDRALLLSHIVDVDFIILLPPFKTNKEYDKLIFQLKPAIIATTKGDLFKEHKIRQADLVKGVVVDDIEPVHNASTTRLAEILKEQI